MRLHMGWLSVVLFSLLALAYSDESFGADATKTTVNVIDARAKPLRGATVTLYKEDTRLGGGETDGSGNFTCPEIDADLESILITATLGSKYGSTTIRVGDMGWPSKVTVKARDRRIQPNIDDEAVTVHAPPHSPYNETRLVVQSYYEERLQLHRDVYGRYFYVPVLVRIDTPSVAYPTRSRVIYSDPCSCLP